MPHPGSGKLLAAVSGGADSMALLHALIAHCATHGIALEAAHIHHGIRGAAADADAANVAAYCAEHGITLHTRHADVPRLAKDAALGLETAARDARYALLEDILRQCGASYCVLAHHRGDQAETVLINLVRGTGARGLSGMRAQRDWLLRPWLDVPASEVRAYALAHALPFADDATNALPDNPRNFMRLRVLPELARLNPSVEAALARAAHALAEDDDALTRLARLECDKRLEGCSFAASDEAWRQLPAAIRKRALTIALRAWGASPEAHHENRLDQWLSRKGIPPRLMDVPGLRVSVRRGVLSPVTHQQEAMQDETQ